MEKKNKNQKIEKYHIIEYDKILLQRAIGYYMATVHKSKITNLAKCNKTELLNMIPKYNIDINELHNDYNKLIDQDIDSANIHIRIYQNQLLGLADPSNDKVTLAKNINKSIKYIDKLKSQKI